jgi:hypothetical protein
VGSVRVSTLTGSTSRADVWERLLSGDDLRSIVFEIEGFAELDRHPRPRDRNADALTFAVIATLLETRLSDPRRWECRSGCRDSSDGPLSVADEWFEAIPAAHALLPATNEALEEARSFWFVLTDGAPLACLHAPSAGVWFSGDAAPVSLLDQDDDLEELVLGVLARLPA